MEKIDIKSLDYAELQNFFESLGEKSFRAKQVYQWIHEKLANGFDEITNLPKILRDRLSAKINYNCLVTASEHAALEIKEKLRLEGIECQILFGE